MLLIRAATLCLYLYLIPNPAQSWQAPRAVRVFAIKAIVVGTIVSNQTPQSAILAADMAPPKMAFFEIGEEVKVGDAIFNEKSQLKAKVLTTRTTFDKMLNRFVSEIKPESGEPKRKDAQATLSIYMGTLKSDMRQLSKIACDGDIYARYDKVGLSGTEEARFDYNTGQFTLKPIAADAESVINAINDLYFNTVPTAPADAILKELDETRKSFGEWFLLIEQL